MHQGMVATVTSQRHAIASRPVWAGFSRRRALELGLGLLGLAAGFAYYALLRRNSPALVQDLVGGDLYGLWPWLAESKSVLTSFPTHIHVVSFTLLSVAVLGRPGWRPCAVWAGVWTGINVLFECLQGIDHAAFSRFMSGLPWRMEALTAFVTGGVFDLGDVLAAVSGGAVAFVISWITNGKGEDHVA